MSYRPVLIAKPKLTPVSVGEAKAHCHVDDNYENNLLAALIEAAATYLDGWSGVLGRCLVTQTWRQDFDGFEPALRLPLAPASEIVSIAYTDPAGPLTVAAENYRLLVDERGPLVRFVSGFSAPSLDVDPPAVSVTFKAGYGVPEDVPQALRQAMLLLIGHWYDHRQGVVVGTSASEVPMAVDALIAPFRRLRC